jgi:hypothetical protein
VKILALITLLAAGTAAALHLVPFAGLGAEDDPRTAQFSVSGDRVYAPDAVARVAQQYCNPSSFETEYNGRYIFTRVRFEEGRGMGDFRGFGRGRGREAMWAHDLPSAECNFSKIVGTISYVRPTYDAANVVMLDEERIFQFPVLYIVEVGSWNVREEEIRNLREYLLRGGFLIVDDLDDGQMYWFAQIMERVLPENPMQQMDGSEPLFNSFFAIDPKTLTFHGAAYRGDQIDFWGIFEDNDRQKRQMVVVGNRGDLGEFWEYSDTGFFPVDITNEAYKVGVNYIVYAMTH